MATKQTSSGSGTRKTAAAAAAGRGGAGRTGERDEHYDVVSVLYHSLQGAETCGQYISDARSARDAELVSFFEETRSEYAARAAQAKELLAGRLERSASGLDEEELEDEDDDDDADDDADVDDDEEE